MPAAPAARVRANGEVTRTRPPSWTVTFGETTMPTKPLWPIVTSPAARMACVPPFSMETSPLATSGPQPPLWMVTPPFARTGPHPPFTMERLPSVATSPAPDLVSCRSRALTIPTIDLVTFPSDGNRTAPAALRPCSSMATSAVLIDPEALSLLGRPNAPALAAWNLCSLRAEISDGSSQTPRRCPCRSARRTRPRRSPLVKAIAFLALALASLSAAAVAQQTELGGKVRSGQEVTVPAEETVPGDLIASAGTVRIDGRVDGDLVASGGQVTVAGTVTGDVLVAAGTTTISGDVG